MFTNKITFVDYISPNHNYIYKMLQHLVTCYVSFMIVCLPLRYCLMYMKLTGV